MMNDRLVYALDAPLIEAVDQQKGIVPGIPQQVRVRYRMWVVYLTIHIINGTVGIEYHGFLAMPDAMIAFDDGWLGSTYTPERIPVALNDAVGLIARGIDTFWVERASEKHRTALASWSHSMREMAEQQAPPSGRSPIISKEMLN